MQAAVLDAEARRRQFVRWLLNDLAHLGVPRHLLKDKTVGELIELREAAARQLMRPGRAA